MFGLIYGAVVGVVNLGAAITAKIRDHEGKERGIRRRINGINEANVYFDNKGRMRDIDTNALRNIWRVNGDNILYGDYGKQLRNLSEEQRIKDVMQRKSQADSDTRAVYYTTWTFGNSPIRKGIERITGDIYIDVKTNEQYLVRHINWNPNDLSENVKWEVGGYKSGEFYLRVSNAEIVDLTDSWKRRVPISVEKRKEIDEFIAHFNDQQRDGGWSLLARHGNYEQFYVQGR